MFYRHSLLLMLCLLPAAALADERAESTEQHIQSLDRDHDGQVSITEIRLYLEAERGKGYAQTVLGEMETKATTSCGSPFSRSFY
jgi:Ca2+-binding EF-hand superfamily protein